jgi:hypothetical protein
MYITWRSGVSPALITANAAANSLRSSTSRGLQQQCNTTTMQQQQQVTALPCAAVLSVGN